MNWNRILLYPRTLLFLLLAVNTWQVCAQNLEVLAVGNFDFGRWNYSGNFSMSNTHCVAAADTPRRSGWTSKDSKKDYEVTVTSTSESKSFTLFKDGILSSDATKRIPIRIYHEDVLSPGAKEELSPATKEKDKQPGQFFGCPSGNNSRLTITIDSANLAKVQAGTYQETLSLLVTSSGKSKTVTFTVSVVVDNGSNVRISRLNTVAFGSYTRQGDISRRENFCVHSSALDAGYTLSITAAQGSSASFTMVPAAGGSAIPLAVSFSGAVSTTASVTPARSMSDKGSSSTDCNGTDNAYLDLKIKESDLSSAVSGRYTQTLILRVEPL